MQNTENKVDINNDNQNEKEKEKQSQAKKLSCQSQIEFWGNKLLYRYYEPAK